RRRRRAAAATGRGQHAASGLARQHRPQGRASDRAPVQRRRRPGVWRQRWGGHDRDRPPGWHVVGSRRHVARAYELGLEPVAITSATAANAAADARSSSPSDPYALDRWSSITFNSASKALVRSSGADARLNTFSRAVALPVAA